MHEVLPVSAQPPAARFDYFRSAVSATFCPMSCETAHAGRRDFEGDLALNRLNELSLVVIGSSPLDVYRRRSDISRVADAWYLVKFQLEGEGLVRQREREAHLQPGDFVLCSTSEPYSLHFPATYREAVLAIPQHRLRDLVRSPDAYLGRRMPAADPVNGLLSQFVFSLSERLDSFDPALAKRLEANVLDLLVTALEFGRERHPGVPEIATQHLYRARNFIRLHLEDPQLSPERIAQAEGISKRYLHMLFKQAGASVSSYIRLQRLEACRKSLARPEFNGMSVSEIAFGWGFNDSSHFNRLFKAQFGMTPKCYRVQAQAGC
jgi:AraC-like DNA-binding protein